MRRRLIALVLAVVGSVVLLAAPAGAVKDGPGCGAGVGVPGKPPLIRIDC